MRGKPSSLLLTKLLFVFILIMNLKCNNFYGQGLSTVSPIEMEQILVSATEITNIIESTREIPESAVIAGNTLNSAQILSLFARTIIFLEDGQESIINEISQITSPSDFYPSIVLDDELYDNAIEKSDYLLFCSKIVQISLNSSEMPNNFSLLDKSIRFSEAFHFLSGILRFYYFFNYLPALNEIMIVSPNGLVPWKTPDGYEHYTSMINGWVPYNFVRYNYYDVGKYSMYKLGREIVGNETDYIKAGNKIYDWVRSHWFDGGYWIFMRTFGSRMSAEELLRYNLTNSAFHFPEMNGLFRSLGIPASEHVLYSNHNTDWSQGWINTNIHCAFGTAPNDCPYNARYNTINEPAWDVKPFPDKRDLHIQNIKNVMSYSGFSSEFSSVWINPTDIIEYGPDYILKKISTSGIKTIILTVKTELGNLYYQTDEFPERMKFDALTQLTNLAPSYGINVYAGFSVLADGNILKKHNNWIQMTIDENANNGTYPNMSISPGVSEYRNQNVRMLRELSKLNINGVVLSHLYFDTIGSSIEMGGNPACEPFRTNDKWQEDLLQDYAKELIDAIKLENPNLPVIITTYPISTGLDNRLVFGHENRAKMAQVADGIIIPYDGNFWLSEPQVWADYNSYPSYPKPFDMQEYIREVTSEIEKPVIVSQNVTDEWEFSSVFYSGLSGYVNEAGASGINLHSPTSMLGEWGVSFKPTQFQKIEKINFSKSYTLSTENPINNSEKRNYILYPNPVSGILSINSEKPLTKVEIYSILGKKVREINSNFNTIQTANLENGVYILRMHSEYGTIIRKFIKQ